MAIVEEIKRLRRLQEEGSLTHEQFLAAKNKLLESNKPFKVTSRRQSPRPRRPKRTYSTASTKKKPADTKGRDWAMVLHLSQLCGFVVPLAGFIVPFILWHLKGHEIPSLRAHWAIVLNWILSWIFYFFFGLLMAFGSATVMPGLMLLWIPLAFLFSTLALLFPLIGGIKAGSGEVWPYPLSIPFFAIPRTR